jgi:hypothetical protein
MLIYWRAFLVFPTYFYGFFPTWIQIVLKTKEQTKPNCNMLLVGGFNPSQKY